MEAQEQRYEREPGGAEPGLPGEAPTGSAIAVAEHPRHRRQFTSAERLELVTSFVRDGGRFEDFVRTRDVSAVSLRKWVRAFEQGGAGALETKPNRRNGNGRSRGYYSPEERRAILEAYEKSGLGQRQFARTYGVALKSLSNWIARYQAHGPQGLEPKPRGRRAKNPQRLAEAVRAEITRTSLRFPHFGMRRVRDFLKRFQGIGVSASSVRKTLTEAGIEPLPRPAPRKRKPMPPRRFERASPGELWQSDITSFLLKRHSVRVYLTVFLDDFSRYVVSWALATHQRQELVSEALMEGIARFGKPKEVLTDQGRQYYAWRGKSEFQKLLVREGIEHVVSRAHHPETLGKCERLWETIDRELWTRTRPQDLVEARERLAHWFSHYNHFRPHQGLDSMVPADRFFGAERAVRAALEKHMSDNEIGLSLGERLKKPAFLIGQIGDKSVSLHGEDGRLVWKTSDGERVEVMLDEIGMPHSGKEQDGGAVRGVDGGAGGSGSGSSAADAPLQEARALHAAQADPVGEGPVGVGERRGAGPGASDVRLDAGVLAGPSNEGGDDGSTGAAWAAGVAVEPGGAVWDAGGPVEAAPHGTEARTAGESRDERADRAAQGERAAEARAGADPDRERALEGSAAESRGAGRIGAESGEACGEKKAADACSPERERQSSPAGCVSEEEHLAESWLAWLERSA
jgi:transposase InsO family protein/transposase-like protein